MAAGAVSPRRFPRADAAKPLATLRERGEHDGLDDHDASVVIVETVGPRTVETDGETVEKTRGDVVDVVVVQDREAPPKKTSPEAADAPAPRAPSVAPPAAAVTPTKISEETRVGQRLSELTTRRVIVGVLGMLFALPWFDLDTYPSLAETSFKDGGLRVLHAFAAAGAEAKEETREEEVEPGAAQEETAQLKAVAEARVAADEMRLARARLGADQAVQGNMDPVHLFAKKEFIVDKVHDTIKKAGNKKHVMNLGHGVMQGTPEENVATFFQTVRDYRY